MPRGDKSSYTGKQKRQAEHIEEGYERRGVSEDEAEHRAWATVNKQDHGGKKSESRRGKPIADVLFNEEGHATRLRLDAASHLGLGTRRVEVPQGAFMMSRGRVVLELPADTVLALPEVTNASDEKE